MRLRWNIDGKGPRSIPPRLADFARRKRREFFLTMAGSAAAGFGIGRVAAWWCGAPGAFEVAALLQCAAATVTAIAAAIGISALA